MIPRNIALLMLLLDAGCSANTLRDPVRANSEVATFRNGPDAISIDLNRQDITIVKNRYPLEDCSTQRFHCYKNETIGFHFAFPKHCSNEGEGTGGFPGGYRFYVTRTYAHRDSEDGAYISDLGQSFSFTYLKDHGLVEIMYDKSGGVGFGARDRGSSLNSQEADPYRFALVGKRPFLRCEGAV